MKYLIFAVCLYGIWASYKIGFQKGLEGSAEYSAALVQRASLLNSAEIDFLTSMALAPPTISQCLPVIKGLEIDEYQYCAELLSDSEPGPLEGGSDADRY